MAGAGAAVLIEDSDLQASPALHGDTSSAAFTAEELDMFLMATSHVATEANSSMFSVLEASQSEEDALPAASKRMRRTEIERMSRRRRQASLRSMRDEVKGLETQFATLLAGHAVRKRGDGWQRQLLSEMDDAVVSVSLKAETGETKFADQLLLLRDKFINLKLLEKELESEQKNLNRMLRGRELLSMSIQSLAFTLVRDWIDVESNPSPSVPWVDFTPVSAEEYATFMRDAYAEITAIDANAQYTSSGNQCMGWSDRRFSDNEKVVFSMTKTFEGRRALPIMEETWSVFSDEARLQQSFGAWGTTMEMRVLDRPSKDLWVLYRTNTRPNCPKKRFHVVYLLFRVQTEDGFTVCMRHVPSLQTPLKGPGKWTGMLTWVHFRESSDACQVEYNNYFPALKLKHRPLADILIGFISTVVRWESACVAPRLIL